MGKKLAIKGHPTRGNEVIELFKMMGGWECGYCGCGTGFYYYISQFGNIEASCKPSKFDTYIVYTLEEFLEKFPYKVGDIVKIGKDEEGVIKQMRWVNNDIVYWVNSHKTCDWTQTLSVDVLDKYNRVNSNDVDVKVESTGFMQICKTAGIIFNDANYADEVELNLGDYEIEVRDGKTYAVKKKPKYPKTIEECVKLLRVDFKLDMDSYKRKLMANFYRLILCRDTYWKIAGEEMGLGKPWEPNWDDEDEYKYGLFRLRNTIYKDSSAINPTLLIFPTQEMRDVFYENFKYLIEQCKELL
jgi:hypothetical protein